eukprot:784676_1
MNSAYDDNYWNDQGGGGVHGAGDAYGDSGMSNKPNWANEPDYNDPKYNNNDWQKDPEQPKKEAPKKKESTSKKKKKSKWGSGKKDDDVTVDKTKQCCSPRVKRYMGVWLFFVIAMAIGIILMVISVIIPGLIIFLIGLAGLFCSGYCFRKCS